MTDREQRLAGLRRKRAASLMPNGNVALGYKARVEAIDKEIARLEAADETES